MRWSWEKHPETSEKFGEAILDHILLLSDYPYLGVQIARRKGVRKLLHSPVRIYYRVNERTKSIEILRLSHAAHLEPRF